MTPTGPLNSGDPPFRAVTPLLPLPARVQSGLQVPGADYPMFVWSCPPGHSFLDSCVQAISQLVSSLPAGKLRQETEAQVFLD